MQTRGGYFVVELQDWSVGYKVGRVYTKERNHQIGRLRSRRNRQLIKLQNMAHVPTVHNCYTSHCEMLITKGPQLEKNVYMKYASCPWVHSADRGRFGWYRVIGRNKVYRADA
jgi:hypothetical protein